MKRPCFALSSLLAVLALGLVAAGPKRSQAGSLGQLAFAVQVEETDAGDPIVCPLVCCPFNDEMDRCEAVLQEEADIELNAAQTNPKSETQLAADDSGDHHDLDYDHYYSEYGYDYSDEFGNTPDPFAAEEETASNDVGAMELNAAQTAQTDSEAADKNQADYGGEYANDYDYYDEDYDYDYDYEQYNDELSSGEAEDVTDAPANTAATEPEDAADHRDDYYQEYYYGDYSSEDFDAEEYYEDDEDDYERYYSQEYYDHLDDASSDETSAGDATTDEAIPNSAADETPLTGEDYMSDYDQLYDQAVYGAPRNSDDEFRADAPHPPHVADDAEDAVENIAEDSLVKAYLAGCCIDESNSELIDDLPWADEVIVADVAEIDVPAAPVAEAGPRDAEYGADYADDADENLEDFYQALEVELPPRETAAQAAAPAPAACEKSLPVAAVKTVDRRFNVARLATYCGSQVAAWTETFSKLGRAVHSAYADFGKQTQTR